MEQVAVGKPFVFECDGQDLAKVLTYYGLQPNTAAVNCKVMCPFHKDKNPSMIASFDTGRFYCFGCNTSGDALDFVKLMNPKWGHLKAVYRFRKILKSDKVMKVKAYTGVVKEADYGSLYDISCDYYFNLPKTDWQSDESDMEPVKRYLENRGFEPWLLNKVGAKITFNNSYPVVFPMYDNKKFKGWVCRTTTKEIEEKRKYLYNRGFSRETTLAGIYGKYSFVFVVEGYMDMLKFRQYGVDNVVAFLGWKMSATQEKELRNAGITHIISALDNDECGRKGTEYLRTRFEKVTRFRYLKGFKDPGDMSRDNFIKMYMKTMEEALDEKSNGSSVKMRK